MHRPRALLAAALLGALLVPALALADSSAAPQLDSAAPPALAPPLPDASPLATNPGLQGAFGDGPVLMGPGLLLAPALPDVPFHIRLKLEPRSWV